MKQKKLRSLSAMLLIGWCLIFLRCETTEKSMVRALYLAQKEQSITVGLLYQAPEAAADASEASGAVQLQLAQADTLAKALAAAQKQLPQKADYRLCDYLLVDGLHEGIVSEELWHEAQVKLLAQAEKYEHVNRGKDTKIHLLSGIVKCPVCGVGMYGNKSIKHKADGSKYKDFYYYGCKHRAMTRGHKCDFKKQINEELLDSAVAEVIVKLVSNPKFAAMMQEKISMKVDTSSIEQEIAAHEKQLRQSYSVKVRLMDEIDSLDPDDKHYIKRKADLDDRLYKMYDKIEDTENQLVAARAKKMAIEAEKLTGDNIYKVLIFFDKLYSVMDDQEKRQLMESLLSEVQIYEERQPNGQWLKSIKFKLPILAEDMSLSLDNDTHIETVCLLVK